MELNKITDKLSVSGQTRIDDIAFFASQDFGPFICIQPDNENADQSRFRKVDAVANKTGLAACRIVNGDKMPASIADMTHYV